MKGFLKIEATEEGTVTNLTTQVDLENIRPTDRFHMVKVFLEGMEMTAPEALFALKLIKDGFFEKDDETDSDQPTEDSTAPAETPFDPV